MVEVDGVFVNPPQKHSCPPPTTFGGDIAFVVAFKV
jgi:hypothetical protein